MNNVPSDVSNEISYPMIPIRDVVCFPFSVLRFKVGRSLSISALDQAIASDRLVFIATQHDATIETPTMDQIYRTGTVAEVTEYEKLEDGEFVVQLQGLERGEAVNIEQQNGWLARVIKLDEQHNDDLKISQLFDQLKQYVRDHLDIIETNKLANIEILHNMLKMDNPSRFCDGMAVTLVSTLADKQCILATPFLADRLALVLEMIKSNIAQH